jgi:DNA-binding NarL/FixJ family response regulator
MTAVLDMVPDDRELDLLAAMADGRTLHEIAQELSFTDRAVRTILREVTDRLGARNATQAVAVAARNGWI